MNTHIQEYSKTAAALADLHEIYAGVVYDVTTTKGMTEAKEGRKELRTLRTDLEKMRVAIKAPALERCRLIDAEAKDITAKLLALEEPIDAQIKAEENKEKEAAMAKAAAERKAQEEAERIKREAEETKLAAERAEIDRVRAEQAEQQRKIDEQMRVSREAIEAAERESRRKIEEQEAAAKAERDAAQAKIRAEQEVVEAAAKKLREEQEAAERERQRAENAKLDAREMLEAFVTQYGHIGEFSGVCKSINEYFSTIKEAA